MSKRIAVSLFSVVMVSALMVAWIGSSVPPRKPDLADVSLVLQKQDAWLEKHPLLLKVSRSQFAGIPGDMLTSAWWHLTGALKGHSTSPTAGPAAVPPPVKEGMIFGSG